MEFSVLLKLCSIPFFSPGRAWEDTFCRSTAEALRAIEGQVKEEDGPLSCMRTYTKALAALEDEGLSRTADRLRAELFLRRALTLEVLEDAWGRVDDLRAALRLAKSGRKPLFEIKAIDELRALLADALIDKGCYKEAAIQALGIKDFALKESALDYMLLKIVRLKNEGTKLSDEGKFQRALQPFTQALKANRALKRFFPDKGKLDLDLYIRRALCYEQMGQCRFAEQDLSRAYTLSSGAEKAEIVMEVGHYLLRHKHYVNAVHLFLDGCRSFPQSSLLSEGLREAVAGYEEAFPGQELPVLPGRADRKKDADDHKQLKGSEKDGQSLSQASSRLSAATQKKGCLSLLRLQNDPPLPQAVSLCPRPKPDASSLSKKRLVVRLGCQLLFLLRTMPGEEGKRREDQDELPAALPPKKKKTRSRTAKQRKEAKRRREEREQQQEQLLQAAA